MTRSPSTSALAKGGYRTASFGKVDFLSGGHSLGARLFAWTKSANITLPQHDRPEAEVAEGTHRTFPQRDWKTIDKTVEWLKENARQGDQPFFLYCGTNIPHPSFRTSKYWYDKIDPIQDNTSRPTRRTCTRSWTI